MRCFRCSQSCNLRLHHNEDLCLDMRLRAHRMAPELSPHDVYCADAWLDSQIRRTYAGLGIERAFLSVSTEQVTFAFSFPEILGGTRLGHAPALDLHTRLDRLRDCVRGRKLALGV